MNEQERQMKIMRQSQLKLVLDWSTSCNKCLTSKELITMTEVFVDYTNNGYTKELGDRLSKLDEYLKK